MMRLIYSAHLHLLTTPHKLFALGFIMPPFWVACAGLLLVNYCSYNTAFQSPHDLKAKLEELFLQNKKNGFISPSHVSKITAMDYYREMANDCLAVSMDMHSRTEANFTKWGYYSILGLCIYFIIGLLIYLIAKHSSFDHLWGDVFLGQLSGYPFPIGAT